MSTREYDVHSAVEVLKAIAKSFGDWVEPPTKLSQLANDIDTTPRSLEMLPIGNPLQNRTCVTSIADAANG